MDTQGEAKVDPQSNTDLLSQILVFLQRIDSHLEVQEERIRRLDSKITGYSNS
jgi:hypothetical protein